jgi:pyruvate dehydrogenase E2 component (dihydrolipoamide acetyltransferase)
MTASLTASVNASPLALRLAAAKGISLDAIKGSGNAGRILKVDILPAPPMTVSSSPVTREMPGRRDHAAHLLDVRMHCPLAPLLALREMLNASLSEAGPRVSLTDLVTKAIAQALVTARQDNLRSGNRTTATDLRLLPPTAGLAQELTIAGAGTRTVSAIARLRLANEASDHEPGAATLRNLGPAGPEEITPALDEHAFVAVGLGAASERPSVQAGEVISLLMVTISVRFDTSVIDEAAAARFMVALREAIESPLLLLV